MRPHRSQCLLRRDSRLISSDREQVQGDWQGKVNEAWVKVILFDIYEKLLSKIIM